MYVVVAKAHDPRIANPNHPRYGWAAPDRNHPGPQPDYKLLVQILPILNQALYETHLYTYI